MSKKDFIALADAIRNHNRVSDKLGDGQAFTLDHLNTLIGFCQEQNPAFKSQRWLDYIAGRCGPNGGAIRKEAAAS